MDAIMIQYKELKPILDRIKGNLESGFKAELDVKEAKALLRAMLARIESFG